MTLIDKLPLIRGWNRQIIPITQTVLLNQEILVYQHPTPTKDIGWLQGLTFVGNDSYLGLRIVAPGIDTGYGTFAGVHVAGVVQPTASAGNLSRYWQPNPLRTWGYYAESIVDFPSGDPYYGPVRIYVSLRTGSTEPSATCAVGILYIAIEDRNLFLTDLRKVLYGRWAPLMDLIGHIPILRTFVSKFEELGIPFEEKEVIEPPGVAR